MAADNRRDRTQDEVATLDSLCTRIHQFLAVVCLDYSYPFNHLLEGLAVSEVPGTEFQPRQASSRLSSSTTVRLGSIQSLPYLSFRLCLNACDQSILSRM